MRGCTREGQGEAASRRWPGPRARHTPSCLLAGGGRRQGGGGGLGRLAGPPRKEAQVGEAGEFFSLSLSYFLFSIFSQYVFT